MFLEFIPNNLQHVNTKPLVISQLKKSELHLPADLFSLVIVYSLRTILVDLKIEKKINWEWPPCFWYIWLNFLYFNQAGLELLKKKFVKKY